MKNSSNTREKIYEVLERILIALLVFINGFLFFVTGVAVAEEESAFTITVYAIESIITFIGVLHIIGMYRDSARFYERMSDRWRDLYLDDFENGGEYVWTVSTYRHGKQGD